MAESIFQPDINSNKSIDTSEQDILANTSPTIIWTPRFIALFTLTLILGLTVDSFLTTGWVNHFYAGAWVPLLHLVLILSCWIAIIVRGHTWEMRMGGIFGCIWSVFSIITAITSFFNLASGSPAAIHLQLALTSALLGCYICLSIERILLDIWDIWFFRLALVTSLVIALVIFLLIPADTRSLNTLESIITTILLFLCLLVWWARPACWKIHPGPTLLFGTVPALLLLLSVPQGGSSETNYFISLVSLLSLLLGQIRVLQGEMQHSPTL